MIFKRFDRLEDAPLVGQAWDEIISRGYHDPIADLSYFTQEHRHVVAYIAEDPVGIVSYMSYKDSLGRQVLFLPLAYVVHEYRHRGIFKELFNFVKTTLCSEAEADIISLGVHVANELALDVYSKVTDGAFEEKFIILEMAV